MIHAYRIFVRSAVLSYAMLLLPPCFSENYIARSNLRHHPLRMTGYFQYGMQVELHDFFALNLGILFLLSFALSAFTTDFDVDT